MVAPREYKDQDGNPVSRYRELGEYAFSAITGVPVATLRNQRCVSFRGEGIPFIKRGRAIRYTLFMYEQHLDEIARYPGAVRRTTRRAG